MLRMTGRIAFLLVTLGPLAMSGLAGPHAYHVAVLGSDMGPGTAAQPLKTIQKAVELALPGDSIVVHAGTYPEVVTITKSGAAGQRIKILGAGDGEVVVKPLLPRVSCSERSPTRARAFQFLRGADYWTLRGLTIVGGILVEADNAVVLGEHVRDRWLPGRGSYDPLAARDALPKLKVNGADEIRIMENKITGRGILTAGARYGRIVKNEIFDIDCGTGAAIWINRFSDGWIVRENHVHDVAASDEHYMSEGIRQGGMSAYNLIVDNVVEDLAGNARGITTDMNASWNTIVRNVVRRTDHGFNEQVGAWGNRWIGNRSESNRSYAYQIYGQGYTQESPGEESSTGTLLQCNVAVGNPVDLHVGAMRQGTFITNAFQKVWISPNLRSYWRAEGNTWDGSSEPPPGTTAPEYCK